MVNFPHPLHDQGVSSMARTTRRTSQGAQTPTAERLDQLDAQWRAANYLGAAQIYLQRNALLREPLQPADIKPRLLGHWGTTPGLTLIYTHLNRLIQDAGANMLLVVGPGHGAPAILAELYLEGTLGDYYPDLSTDEAGINRLVSQFSWPGGMPSHVGPLTPATAPCCPSSISTATSSPGRPFLG